MVIAFFDARDGRAGSKLLRPFMYYGRHYVLIDARLVSGSFTILTRIL